MKQTEIIMLALFSLFTVTMAQAQEVTRRPSAQEIVERLTPPPETYHVRSIQPRSISAKGVTVEGRKTTVEDSPSIDLDVNFEYNSDKLTADARLMLDNLGSALTDPSLKDSHFLLAGHTDASGGDAYNLALSKRRAQAVADYLTSQYGVEAARLKVEGYGRNKLLDLANPNSAMNRRVQVVNLGQ